MEKKRINPLFLIEKMIKSTNEIFKKIVKNMLFRDVSVNTKISKRAKQEPLFV